MGAHSSSLDELILSIHATCLSEDGWARVISNLCQEFHARGAALVRAGRNPDFRPFVTLFEFDPVFVRQYVEHWAHQDIWYDGAVHSGRVGTGLVNVGEQLVDYRDYKQSAFFNEYLKPMNIDRMMNACLAGPDRGYNPTAISFYRALGKEAFSMREAELLSRLAPHLGVAVQNYCAVQSMRLLARAQANALDAITYAVVGIDSSARVAFTNQTADELLHQGRWVQISNQALAPSKSLLEAGALTRALRQLAAGISFKLIVTDHLTGAQAVVSGAPLALVEGTLYPRQTSSLIWITPIVPNSDGAANLATLFALTPAERRLIGRLIVGDDLREAASNLHISLYTAQTQLKSVFAKTGRRTQAALLTLVTRLSTLRATIA